MELGVFCSSLFVLGHSFLPFSSSCREFSTGRRSSATFLFSAWPVIFFGVLLLVKLQSGIPRNVLSIESTFELFTHRNKAPMIERRDVPLLWRCLAIGSPFILSNMKITNPGRDSHPSARPWRPCIHPWPQSGLD